MNVHFVRVTNCFYDYEITTTVGSAGASQRKRTTKEHVENRSGERTGFRYSWRKVEAAV